MWCPHNSSGTSYLQSSLSHQSFRQKKPAGRNGRSYCPRLVVCRSTGDRQRKSSISSLFQTQIDIHLSTWRAFYEGPSLPSLASYAEVTERVPQALGPESPWAVSSGLFRVHLTEGSHLLILSVCLSQGEQICGGRNQVILCVHKQDFLPLYLFDCFHFFFNFCNL